MATTAYSAQYTPNNTITFPKSDNQTNQMHDDHNNYYYNNNNHTRAREGMVDNQVKQAIESTNEAIRLGDFAQTYEDSLGRPMPRIVGKEIADMMGRGIAADLIHAVIEYTAGAPRPSWAYARAVILRNWAKGVNGEEEFLESLGR